MLKSAHISTEFNIYVKCIRKYIFNGRGEVETQVNGRIALAKIADQLMELRKSSLAKLICDTSDGITHAQVDVMRSAGRDNPMISCENIPGPSFAPWKEERSSHRTSWSNNTKVL